MNAIPWSQHPFSPLSFNVGLCAWRITMLPACADYINVRPSLIVATPEDDDETLRAAAPFLKSLPIMVGFHEPPFSRSVRGLVEKKLAALGRQRIDVLTMWIDLTADLKGGGMLQAMRALRDEGLIGEIGLAHGDAREIEWIAQRTGARLLVLPYSLGDQTARFRAIDTAHEYGMACLAVGSINEVTKPIPHDTASLRFALAEHSRALPLLSEPLPDDITALNAEQVEDAWRSYRETHAEPAPLARSTPPETAG